MPPVTLRPAAPADAARVADILLASRAAHLPYAPQAHPGHEVRSWVANHLVPSGSVTLALADGEVVGVLAVSRDTSAAWIDQMYLDPAWVGRGIGAHLLAHALATLPRPVRLWTFQQNAGARRFYERHGFRAVRFTDGEANEERCPDVLYERAE